MKQFILFIASLVILACNTSQNYEHLGIELNEGEKWVINEEMKPHIKEAQLIFNKYTSSGDEDYKKLANELKQQNNRLIKSCTMDGKSHDELHKWLHPHIGLIDDLADAASPKDANVVLDLLEESFDAFDVYFQ